MPRVHYVKAAQKDNPAVKKGEPYWYWSTRTTSGKQYISRKHYSAKAPRQSQLTSSEFLQNVYSLQEEMEDAKPESFKDLQAMRDEWVNRINEIRDECQDKLDAMPDGLQQGSTGELLQERIDAMENWANDLEGMDLDSFFEGENESEDSDKLQEQLSELQALGPGV